MEPKITRLPSQVVAGNDFGRRPNRRRQAITDRQIQQQEAWEEAYLIDGRQDDRYRY